MTVFPWTAKQVAEALGMPALSWDHAYTGVSTDTRALQDGELFVALQGERFDAHHFLGDARLAGVGGAVVRHGTPAWPGFDAFEVDDTLDALGRLARYRRDRFEGPVIAITGSTGKTSTKELIAAALSPKYRVHKSESNLNNLVGVPLTVLAAPVDATAMVVECGASLPGELARIRAIVRPTIAVVTTVGAAHLEGFGGLDAVMEEKTSLLDGAETAIVGTQPAALPGRARARAARVVTAGAAGGADWVAEGVTLLEDARPRFRVRGVEITLGRGVRGRHMVDNALIALAVADAAGVPLAEAAPALENATIPGGRSEVVEIEGVTVVNDCYNANPQSLRAAVDLLGALRGERRAIAVVGTMRELGSDAERLHREAAEAVLAAKPDLVVAIGEFEKAFQAVERRTSNVKRSTVEVISGPTPEAVAPALKERLREGDVMLLKASRGVQLEKLIPMLWPDHAAAEAH